MKIIAEKSNSAITYKAGSAQDLAQKIKKLKDDPKSLELMAKNASDFIAKNYDRKNLERRLIEKLNTL